MLGGKHIPDFPPYLAFQNGPQDNPHFVFKIGLSTKDSKLRPGFDLQTGMPFPVEASESMKNSHPIIPKDAEH